MDTRRRVERVHLTQPLNAELRGQRVFIIDASVAGLQIAHQQPVALENQYPVRFDWDGERATANCQVVRTQNQRIGSAAFARSLYHSGLRVVGEAPDALRRMIEWHVAVALDEQKANARGIPPTAVHAVRSGVGIDYMRYELIGGLWRQLPTNDPRQPRNGFTVSIEHSEQEVEMLRTTFQKGDTSARDMLRRMAELSIENPAGVSTRKYTP